MVSQVSQWLDAQRQVAGLSVADVCRRLDDTGHPRPSTTVHGWFKGTAPSRSAVRPLLVALGVAGMPPAFLDAYFPTPGAQR